MLIHIYSYTQTQIYMLHTFIYIGTHNTHVCIYVSIIYLYIYPLLSYLHHIYLIEKCMEFYQNQIKILSEMKYFKTENISLKSYSIFSLVGHY
jgi:hypothetical protein